VGLTQNDVVFVIVATVSPATLYLWIITARALIRGLPNNIARGIPNKHEQVLLIALSFMSFALWVTIVSLTTVGPSHRVKFSQPGCNTTYGKSELATLFWSLWFLLQLSSTAVVTFGVSVCLRRRGQRPIVSLSRNQCVSVCNVPFAI
jgi:hypothetical protein